MVKKYGENTETKEISCEKSSVEYKPTGWKEWNGFRMNSIHDIMYCCYSDNTLIPTLLRENYFIKLDILLSSEISIKSLSLYSDFCGSFSSNVFKGDDCDMLFQFTPVGLAIAFGFTQLLDRLLKIRKNEMSIDVFSKESGGVRQFNGKKECLSCLDVVEIFQPFSSKNIRMILEKEVFNQAVGVDFLRLIPLKELDVSEFDNKNGAFFKKRKCEGVVRGKWNRPEVDLSVDVALKAFSIVDASAVSKCLNEAIVLTKLRNNDYVIELFGFAMYPERNMIILVLSDE